MGYMLGTLPCCWLLVHGIFGLRHQRFDLRLESERRDLVVPGDLRPGGIDEEVAAEVPADVLLGPRGLL